MSFLEILFKIGTTVVIIVAIFWQLLFVKWLWVNQVDLKATFSRFIKLTALKSDIIATRDPNKIYQQGKPVGIVAGQITEKGDTVIFKKLIETTNLNRKEPFEYKRDKCKIVSIGSLSVLDISNSSGVRMGVLRNIVCQKYNSF